MQPTTTIVPMKTRTLREIWNDLLEQARLYDRAVGEDLSGGARLSASIGDSGEIVMSMWRFNAPVGLIEERTFLLKCRVPDWATRVPAEGQFVFPAKGNAGEWHYVAYHWHEEGYQGES